MAVGRQADGSRQAGRWKWAGRQMAVGRQTDGRTEVSRQTIRSHSVC